MPDKETQDILLHMATMVNPIYYFHAFCECGHRFTYGSENLEENRTHCDKPCRSEHVLTQTPAERRNFYFQSHLIKNMVAAW